MYILYIYCIIYYNLIDQQSFNTSEMLGLSGGLRSITVGSQGRAIKGTWWVWVGMITGWFVWWFNQQLELPSGNLTWITVVCFPYKGRQFICCFIFLTLLLKILYMTGLFDMDMFHKPINNWNSLQRESMRYDLCISTILNPCFEYLRKLFLAFLFSIMFGLTFPKMETIENSPDY